jgi:glycosyltransferase involved in cell wall biosynthesis
VVTLHGGVHDVPQDEAASWTEPTKGAVEWGKILGWWVGSRRVLDDAAAILCVGEEERRKTQEAYPGKRVLFLPNGVDAPRFAAGDGGRFRRRHDIPQNAPVLLNVGRIDPQKNQRLLLELLSAVLPAHPDARLLLIGPMTNEGYGESLRRETAERGMARNVTLIPGLPADSDDLLDAFHAADVFVLPSIHEPFGIVILEAWAAGLPVVASRVGGVPAFVEDGQDGFLVDSGDLAGFVAAVNTCLDHPERAREMAEKGRQKARAQYSWESVTSKLEAVYREAVGENPLRK